METLILTINRLQQLKNKFGVKEIELPQIIVVGSQSSGKSSVMERIIGRDILPKASTLATRCPIVLQLVNRMDMGDEIRAVFRDDPEKATPISGVYNIAEYLQKKTNRIGTSTEGVSEEPIIVELYGSTHPTLTLIDLPGLIKNDGLLPKGSTEKIQSLNENYAKQDKSIILAISPANVDLANSDAIHIAEKYDPAGKRTLAVITKIDLMDRGTSIADVLKSDLLKRSFCKICVVNRSQENITNRMAIEDANEYEREFISRKQAELSGDHGIEYLTSSLVRKLESEIQNNLPDMEIVIENRVKTLLTDLKENLHLIKNKKPIVHKLIKRFADEFINLLNGDKATFPDEYVGGAKISYHVYEVFENEINAFQVTKQSSESLKTLIGNTIGHKKMSFSIEKAFASIVRKEIDKFIGPSLKCNDTVKRHLLDFVQDTIKETHIDKYTNLAKRIEKDMRRFIEEKHFVTKLIIENLIRGEKVDIFCMRPNTLFPDTPESQYTRKVSALHGTLFKNSIDNAAQDYNIAMTPQLKQLILNAYDSNSLSLLKDAILQFPDEYVLVDDTKQFNMLKKMKKSEKRSTMPIQTTMSDMVNKVTENSNESMDLYNILSKEKELPSMIQLLMDRTMKREAVAMSQMNPNVPAIEAMVVDYFKVVQQNMIRNVPKWIQTVFIMDMMKELDTALYDIENEDNLEFLLNISYEEAKLIQMKHEELEELKSILNELLSLRKRRNLP